MKEATIVMLAAILLIGLAFAATAAVDVNVPKAQTVMKEENNAMMHVLGGEQNIVKEHNTMPPPAEANSAKSEINKMASPAESVARRPSTETKKTAEKNVGKAMAVPQEGAPRGAAAKSAGGMEKTGNEVKKEAPKYRPAPKMPVPIPATVAKVAREHNVEVRCYKKGCYMLVDKNAAEGSINHILDRIMTGSKARIHVLRKGKFAVVEAVVPENNVTKVQYATDDSGIFAVTVEIPKSEVNSADLIEGNVIFLKTDPVLKIYLRNDENGITVSGFTIKKVVELNTTASISFAACTVGFSSVNMKDGQISFQITDGNQPVYVPNVHITTPAGTVIPQYNPQTRTYSAKLAADTGKIVAYVSGCGDIIYPITPEAEKKRSSTGATVATALVLLAIIAAGILVAKRS